MAKSINTWEAQGGHWCAQRGEDKTLTGRGRFELEAIADLLRLEAAPLHVREASPDPWKFRFAWWPTRLDDGSWTWLAGYERRYVSAPPWFSHNCLGWVERQRLPSRKVY